MLNPLNNASVRKKVFDRAELELNKALLYRQKQFNDSRLYFEAALVNDSPKLRLCRPAINSEPNAVLVEMTIAELLNDGAIQSQLEKIPKLLRNLIKWDRLITYINTRLQDQLQDEHTLEAQSGNERTDIVKKKGQQTVQSAVTLQDIFDWK